MTDNAKQKAWQRRCSQLEALGLDPYAPQVPTDDSRHPQVEAILTEYKVAIGEVVPVPPGWEGHRPLRPFHGLADLAAWLNEQRGMVGFTEMGGEAYKANALEEAARAVRNGFRVLTWLGVDEPPERPFPVETLAAAKQQLDDLERWVRQKVKDGWTSPKPSQPEEASPTTTVKRRKRDELPDDYEANILINRHLTQHPRAAIRDVAQAVGLSIGKVQQTNAWRHEMSRRNAAKPPPKVKERPLTKKMQASIPDRKVDNIEDIDARIDRRDALWRQTIEEASPGERGRLNAMTRDEREALIDTKEQQDADCLEQEMRWQRRCS
jgi:hypothetical protein